jgi:hypothetical protein
MTLGKLEEAEVLIAAGGGSGEIHSPTLGTTAP